MTAYEKLVEECAAKLCDTRTWLGAWARANEVERGACRVEARAILALVYERLQTVRPEQVEAANREDTILNGLNWDELFLFMLYDSILNPEAK